MRYVRSGKSSEVSGYRKIAISVSSAMFMQFLDATALNTAIPAIARDMQAAPVDLNVAILSYQLSMAVFVPLGSLMAERLGARNAYVLSLVLFLAGSIACALAPSLAALTTARALQGAGGAVMVPVSRMLVVRSVEKSELITALNWVTIPGILGPVMGPAIGGLIVTHASWQWIFLINIPVGLLSMAAVFAFVPDIRDKARTRPDWMGMTLAAPAIFALVFGLESAVRPDSGWLPAALLAIGGGFVLLYVRHEKTAAAPVLDFSLLAIPTFRHSLISSTYLRIAFAASSFLFPLWFQLAMGMSPAQAGAIMVMAALGGLLSRSFGIPLMRRMHPRSIAIAGPVLLAMTLLLCAGMRPDWPLPLFYLAIGLQGVALSIPLVVTSAATYVEVPAERTAQAATLYTTVQQLTLSLGVTTGVWSISLMGWISSSGERDNLTYAGSIVILAVITLLASPAAARLDRETMGRLSRRR